VALIFKGLRDATGFKHFFFFFFFFFLFFFCFRHTTLHGFSTFPPDHAQSGLSITTDTGITFFQKFGRN
jgi:hypothetical protein